MLEELKRLDEKAKNHYYAGEFVESLMTYAEVFVKFPKLSLAYNNYGNILREIGLPELSYGFLETAIKIDPENKIYGFNLAVAHLLNNELETGWELFEERWRFKGHEHTLLGWPKPRWEGQNLTGKRLLITCEEGDGDNIQFSRFTEHLTSLGAHVIHQTEPGLHRLFLNSFPDATVITNRDSQPEFDYWTPILSIPRALKLYSYSDLPYVFNYITPSNESVNKGMAILGKKEKLRAGICWSGRTKSYSFEKILGLIQTNPQFQWVNFQIICSEEERKILINSGVVDLSSHVSDWEDTAGIMRHMDVVISIDTGVCHLAGSMGVPCMLLLDSFKTCWRWLLNKEDTAWYPNMRLFRQTQYKGYDEQLDRVHRYLRLLQP